MPIVAFPDPYRTSPDGIVAVGGDVHPDSLLLAYRQGIFPWPHDGLPLLWFCPARRAVLEFSDLRVSDRLARERRNTPLRFTIDDAFEDVIDACRATPRPGQDGTWITPEMIAGYTEAHRRGFVHSVEVWDEAGDLAGGLYGVDCGGLFAGESMFFRRSNASKLALLFLIDHLAARGATWIDIQQLTPHMAALGATLWPRARFLRRLAEEQTRGHDLFGAVSPAGSETPAPDGLSDYRLRDSRSSQRA
jgi:leucyl/phenylalanyl-tRNA--protein transferase